ncbi:MAG: hypothetical protein HRT99_03790 [Mycoplasmatales bacterium]|nr:hypothetical protein [Mycoplasmatales bacterium]
MKKFFGNKKIKDLNKEKMFFINVTNFNKSEICIINNLEERWQETYLWQVALWTSAAPFYFKIKNSPFIDGGIWANDPRVLFTFLKDKIGNLKNNSLFSIGFFSKNPKVKNGRWIFNIKRAVKFIDLTINLSSEINNIEIKGLKQSVRMELDKTRKKEIPVNLINDDVLKFFNKRAKHEKDKILDFVDKMNKKNK